MSAPVVDRESRRVSVWWVCLLLAAVAILAVAAALLVINRDDPEAIEGPTLDLGAVVVEDNASLGQIHLRLRAASPGENELEVDIDPQADGWLASIRTVDLSLLPLVAGGEAETLSLDLSAGEQRGRERVRLDDAANWEIRVDGDAPSGRRRIALFQVLLPDPNLHGNDAVSLAGTDPEAEALYQRASERVSQLHRVTYEQQLSDGEGLGVVSWRAINDGADGSVPGFFYLTPGGMEAVVSGTTAWTRYPGEAWESRETNAMVPPSEWGGEYTGATGFQLGPLSQAPAGPCRVVTFVVPEEERRSIAWYAWCIDETTGHLFRDAMISRNHYMITEFDDFDGDVVVAPPEDAEGPGDAALDPPGESTPEPPPENR
jgi:hypothetical protein